MNEFNDCRRQGWSPRIIASYNGVMGFLRPPWGTRPLAPRIWIDNHLFCLTRIKIVAWFMVTYQFVATGVYASIFYMVLCVVPKLSWDKIVFSATTWGCVVLYLWRLLNHYKTANTLPIPFPIKGWKNVYFYSFGWQKMRTFRHKQPRARFRNNRNK